jgi:hypothetical protein
MNTMQMNTMQSPTQSDDNSVSLLAKSSADTPAVRPAKLKNDRLPAKSSSWRAFTFARHLILLLIGVAATLAWQTYGDSARHMIASVIFSTDQQQFNSTSLDTNSVRQGIDEISTIIASNQEQIMRSIASNQERLVRSVDQLAAGQEQMTREIAKLQEVDQFVLYKSPGPPTELAPAPVPKPAPRPPQKPAALAPAKNP